MKSEVMLICFVPCGLDASNKYFPIFTILNESNNGKKISHSKLVSVSYNTVLRSKMEKNCYKFRKDEQFP